jgi:hypothetical protein
MNVGSVIGSAASTGADVSVQTPAATANLRMTCAAIFIIVSSWFVARR